MAFRAKRQQERQLIKVFQKVIKDEELIDTGALYKAVDVQVQITNAGLMLIDISSMDYLKYLYERFFLLEQFMAKPETKKITEEIFKDFIQDIVKKYPMTSAIKKLESLKTRVKAQIVN